MATYSDRIRELREIRGMSQQALADMLDVNKVTISQYERGARKPDINVVAALCDIFNVSSDYLLGKDDVTIRFVGEDEIKKLDSNQVQFSGQHGAYYLNEDTIETAQAILTDSDLHALFKASRQIGRQDLKLLIDMAERFKETNPDG